MNHDWLKLHYTTHDEVPPYTDSSRSWRLRRCQFSENRGKGGGATRECIRIAADWKQEWETSGPNRLHRHVAADPEEGVNIEDLSKKKHCTTRSILATN